MIASVSWIVKYFVCETTPRGVVERWCLRGTANNRHEITNLSLGGLRVFLSGVRNYFSAEIAYLPLKSEETRGRKKRREEIILSPLPSGHILLQLEVKSQRKLNLSICSQTNRSSDG